jgi:sugar phosphate isomerase/epimerase
MQPIEEKAMRIGFMMGWDRERMEFAKKWGFKSAELQAGTDDSYFPGKPDWQAKAKQMKAEFDAEDIRISCIASFYVNHMDPEEAEQHKALVRGTIDLAKEIGVEAVAGFAGKVVNAQLEASIPEFKKIWGGHAKYAEDAGVKIAFENCPMGHYHQPPGGNNCMCTPGMWEACFNEVPSPALGLEWDPSHLICMNIEPVVTLRKFGKKVHHVHAKDAHVNCDLIAQYGTWYPGTIEHCHVGLGDTDWAECVKELRRQGYTSDLNIEGWHDGVYRNFKDGPQLEDEGLIVGLRCLSQFVVQP